MPLLILAGGCAHRPAENLPAYRWVDGPAALRALCARSRAVHSASAEAALTLTRPDGQSVRLNAAIVMLPPSSVRMRAWKFGQRVFDLTLTPGGLWVEGPEDPGRRGQAMPASLDAAKVARAWSLMSGTFFCDPATRVRDLGGSRFSVERITDGQRIVCEVEKATLTPRQYTLLDARGVRRFMLSLDRYELVNGIAWPVHLDAHSDGGRIEIELKNVELNGELAPNAFVPPRRAQRVK
ncbi:MAG TPA: hypothetical protein VFC78_21945 [Tepidisphaeraceae bacterium]|nr:hypothetical protein [Tepidisphaeraceae bacterium]